MTGLLLGNRYELTNSLGEDHLGRIDLGIDRKRDRPMLLRRFRAQLFADRAAAQSFRRRVMTAAQEFDFFGVQKVHAVGVSELEPWVIVPAALPGTLRAVLSQRMPPMDRLCAWLSIAAKRLDDLHLAGVVHGDLRPETLVFDAADSLALGEFVTIHELCRFDRSAPRISRECRERFFLSQYLAAEVTAGQVISPASDRYALAVAALDALTGRAADLAVFPADRPARLDALFRATNCPETVRRTLSRALANNPDERFSSACEFINELALNSANLSRPGSTMVAETPPVLGQTVAASVPKRHGATQIQSMSNSPQRDVTRPIVKTDSTHGATATQATERPSAATKSLPSRPILRYAIAGAVLLLAFSILGGAWIAGTNFGRRSAKRSAENDRQAEMGRLNSQFGVDLSSRIDQPLVNDLRGLAEDEVLAYEPAKTQSSGAARHQVATDDEFNSVLQAVTVSSPLTRLTGIGATRNEPTNPTLFLLKEGKLVSEGDLDGLIRWSQSVRLNPNNPKPKQPYEIVSRLVGPTGRIIGEKRKALAFGTTQQILEGEFAPPKSGWSTPSRMSWKTSLSRGETEVLLSAPVAFELAACRWDTKTIPLDADEVRQSDFAYDTGVTLRKGDLFRIQVSGEHNPLLNRASNPLRQFAQSPLDYKGLSPQQMQSREMMEFLQRHDLVNRKLPFAALLIRYKDAPTPTWQLPEVGGSPREVGNHQGNVMLSLNSVTKISASAGIRPLPEGDNRFWNENGGELTVTLERGRMEIAPGNSPSIRQDFFESIDVRQQQSELPVLTGHWYGPDGTSRIRIIESSPLSIRVNLYNNPLVFRLDGVLAKEDGELKVKQWIVYFQHSPTTPRRCDADVTLIGDSQLRIKADVMNQFGQITSRLQDQGIWTKR